MRQFRHYSPTEIFFGQGIVNDLAKIVNQSRRIVIVTGKRSAKKSGLCDRLEKILKKGGAEAVFFGSVASNPTVGEVEKIAELAREEKAELVFGVGGGSAMDAAKGVAVLATNRKPLRELFDIHQLENSPLPIVCIPTTAGTGSEVNQYAIITDEKINDKRNLHGKKTYPIAAILDAELTRTLPAEITVDTGIDALCHSIEGYIASRSQAFSDCLAVEAMRIIKDNLPKAYRNGDDMEARGEMLYAATLAGIVIGQTGTTMVHALGYHLTLEYGVPHGRANAALIAHGLDFNYDDASEKIDNIYEIFGGERKRSGIKTFLGFLHSLDVATTLDSYGVKEDGIVRYRDYVMGKGAVLNSPRKVTPENLKDLLRRIFR